MQVLFAQSTDFNNKEGFKLNPLKYVQVGRDLHPTCFYAIGFYVRLCVYYYLFASPACLSGAHSMRSVLPYRALIAPNRLFRHHLHIVNPRRWLLSIHPFFNQSFPLLMRGHRPKTMTGTKNPLTTSQASHVFAFVDTLHRLFLQLQNQKPHRSGVVTETPYHRNLARVSWASPAFIKMKNRLPLPHALTFSQKIGPFRIFLVLLIREIAAAIKSIHRIFSKHFGM